MKETISVKLFRTLNKGKKLLNKEAVSRITRFVESQKTDEDVFVNKNKTADLYYTMFGWLLAYVFNIRLDNKKTLLYLEQQHTEQMDLIHYAAWIRCRLLRQLLSGSKLKLLLSSLSATPVRAFHECNGFPHDDAESPYSRFIRLSLLEDANRKIEHAEEIKKSLSEYKIPGGGYANRKGNGSATTNTTVAALAVLGQLDGYTENEDIRFLQSLQQASGGFAAAVDSPVPDLLSTATALFILRCYNLQPKISPQDFIDAHWLESGGFSATLLEETSDVEYTFYGLLALGAMS